ncbi:hypothetical protein BGZ73_002257 [Actinomortierella ambigua]|nr:hypothetical protein BGZ73_002257 [Actinomortierella ambigua]
MQIYNLLAITSLASACFADVFITSPTADSRWAIGGKSVVTWKVREPSKGTEVADIYLVGGNYQSYKRLETLGKRVPLSRKKIVIPAVSSSQCGSTCAIEVRVVDGGDYYSHNFTIAPEAELRPNPSTSLEGGSGDGSGTGAATLGNTNVQASQANAQSNPTVRGSGAPGMLASIQGASSTLGTILATSALAAASIAFNLL